MKLEAVADLARRGELYPSVILYGVDRERRLEAATELGRTLLCELPAERRPCGSCRHCRRIGIGEDGVFHPDFLLLERDLKTATSVDATKAVLRRAQISPFEARGQVFVLADAESLTDGAANALLKTLEEPATSAPRHFLLLTPAASDLLATLRSRSLVIYLGVDERVAGEDETALIDELAELCEGYIESRSPLHLMLVARALYGLGSFNDPRAGGPWNRAASALVRLSADPRLADPLVRPVLSLAEDLLLRAREYRLRAVPALRILEGLVAQHLALSGPTAKGRDSRALATVGAGARAGR